MHAASFNANWKYRKQSDRERGFSQGYSIMGSLDLTPQVHSSWNVKYTRDYNGPDWSDSFVPTLSLGIVNDIFNLNLSGTSSRRRSKGHPTYITNSWTANVAFPYLSSKKIANLSLNYGETYSKDTGSPRSLDTVSRTWGVNLSRRFFEKINVNYGLTGSWSEDRLKDTESTNLSHVVTTSCSERWNKLSASLSSQFSYTRNVQKAKAEEGKASFWVPVAWRWEVSPEGADLEKGAVAVVDVGGTGIDELRFYTDSLLGVEVPPYVLWDIEVRQKDGEWTKMAEGVSLPYRFTDAFSEGQVRLTVVDVGREGVSLEDPKFIGYRIILGKTGTVRYVTESSYYKINLSLSYDFSRFLRGSYSASGGETFNDPGSKTTEFSQSASLSWSRFRLFGLNVNLSQTTRKSGESPKTESDALGISATSELMETLSVSYGYTYRMSKTGGKKESDSSNYYLSIDAQVYPDLGVRWTHSLTVPSSGAKSYSSHVNVAARLTPNFTVVADHDYSKSWGTGSSSWSQRVSCTASWRVSDVLSLSASEVYTWNKEGEETSSFSSTAGLMLTDKVQANFSVSGSYGKERVVNYSTNLSWNVNRHFAVRFTYSGTRKESGDRPWSWILTVTASF